MNLFNKYYTKALISHESKEYDEAIKNYILALEYNVKMDVMFELALCYFDYNKMDESLNILEEIQCMNENFSSIYYLKALIYENTNINEAKKMYEKCISIDHNYYQAIYNLALLYEEEDINKAIELYEKVLMEFENHLNALINLGSLYETMNENKKALYLFKRAYDIDNGNPLVLFNYAFINKKIGNLKEAILLYEEALRLPNPYIFTFLNYALIYKDEFNDLTKAIEIYTKGINYEENDVLYYNRACCYALLKNHKDALEDLNKAIQRNSDLRKYMYQDDELKDVIKKSGL